jgi:hypothetical protein
MADKTRETKDKEHQLKIEESHRKLNNPEILGSSLVLVEKDLLDKLMDFYYWKEWKNNRLKTPSTEHTIHE